MTQKPELYYLPHSSPCRAVLFTAKALGIELELHNVSVDETDDDKLKLDELCKINPNHTLPTLVDVDGTVFWESHAIQQYLASRYSRPILNEHLYPTGCKLDIRANIDTFLFYDLGAVYRVIMDVIRSYRFDGRQPSDDTRVRLHRMLHQMNSLHLQDTPFLTGEKATIADMAVISSLTFLEAIDFCLEPWPKVFDYILRCKEEHWYQAGREQWEKIAIRWRESLKSQKLI